MDEIVKEEWVDQWWVVRFKDCDEVVLLQGNKEDITVPDDLGCPFESVESLKNYIVKDIWIKNGQIRANVIKAPVDQLVESEDLKPSQ